MPFFVNGLSGLSGELGNRNICLWSVSLQANLIKRKLDLIRVSIE